MNKRELDYYHQSVLLHDSIRELKILENGNYMDATFGGGGHSRLILEYLKKGRLISFDQDEDVTGHLPPNENFIFIRENFRFASRFARLYGMVPLNGVLADLGVSSYQIDTPERGFSTRYSGELDMRMDRRQSYMAKDIIREYDSKSLHKMFERYGQVSNSKTLAEHIVSIRRSRNLGTMDEFKQGLYPVVKGNPKKYLAQVFQALRIEVNDEFGALEDFLKGVIPQLAMGGRIVVITFHSLEDKIVKKVFASFSGNIQGTPEEELLGRVKKQKEKGVILKTKKVVLPDEEELKRNPRSRSAKLRVAERIE